MLVIEPCADRGARTCEVCGERRSGGHFRVRLLAAQGTTLSALIAFAG